MDEKNKKNKWKNKKILGCILTVIIMVATAAGIYFYMNRVDPVRYVQAVLDVSYKERHISSTEQRWPINWSQVEVSTP